MTMQTPIELRLDRLTAELHDLRHELKAALGALPKAGPKWISTVELASELGVTSRTVGKWIAANRFPDAVIRRKRRGNGVIYKLDRDPALKAAEEIMTS